MTDKFIMISLDDEKTKNIADVLGNKTAKKILDFLAEAAETSEQDLSRALNVPINTIEYNLKKLLDAGLVEKAKNFFWSRKGRKIDMYKLARKHIVISHKTKPSLSKLKSIVPTALISGVIVWIVYYFVRAKEAVVRAPELAGSLDKVVSTAGSEAVRAAEAGAAEVAGVSVSFIDKLVALPAWSWFLMGVAVALVIMLILNWRKL